MDFIERLLGLAPDAGTGAYELLLLVSLIAVATRLMARLRTASEAPTRRER